MPDQRSGFLFGFGAYFLWGVFPLYWRLLDHSGAVEGMAIESAAAVPLALAMIVALGIRGDSTVTSNGAGYFLLAVLAGPVTAIPLLMFGAAATRISMTALGLLNYVAPIMQLAIGVLVFREPMSSLRWTGFALVWVALVVLTVDGLTQRRRVAVLAAAV